MHPFGGTPKCPRCNTSVYAAEQIMGPGRKLYHKSCLRCSSCDKRLDSFALVEHNEQPYCKICHVKLFGTVDLRHGNLPTDRDTPSRARTIGARAASPPSVSQPLPRRSTTASPAPDIKKSTSPPPILRPTRALSPSRPAGLSALQALDDLIEDFDGIEVVTPAQGNEEPSDADADASAAVPRGSAAGAGAGLGNGNGYGYGYGNGNGNGNGRMAVPLAPSMTGTRYGAALGGGGGGGTGGPPAAAPLVPAMTGRQFGVNTPKCARCGKSVYFAEQVKAVGKTWHKACLRCSQCGHSLDTGRLVDREGDPFCRPCYGKSFGPAGSGYALLGKAGG